MGLNYLRGGDFLKNIKMPVAGLFIGLLNGLFGAGGGIVAVTAFQKMGMPDKSGTRYCRSGDDISVSSERLFILV